MHRSSVSHSTIGAQWTKIDQYLVGVNPAASTTDTIGSVVGVAVPNSAAVDLAAVAVVAVAAAAAAAASTMLLLLLFKLLMMDL